MSKRVYSVTPFDGRHAVCIKAKADAKALGEYPAKWDDMPQAVAHAERLTTLTGVKWSVCWSEPCAWMS